jgi:arsenate reductase (thioredoxin)
MKILVLCTGNSCRSQMAEAVLQSLDFNLDVVSAGTIPSDKVHPKAVEVMKELDIDISQKKTKNVSAFLSEPFDYVITVCGGAKETCPMFTGNVKERRHIGFDDPAEARGSEEEIYAVFRRVRDEIVRDFTAFYKDEIVNK